MKGYFASPQAGERTKMSANDSLERERLENSRKHLLWLVVELDEMQDYCREHRSDRTCENVKQLLCHIANGSLGKWLDEMRDAITAIEGEMVAMGFTPPREV